MSTSLAISADQAQFCMGSGVIQGTALVLGLGDNFAIENQHCTEGTLASQTGLFC